LRIGVVRRGRLGEALRRGADDAERVPHLVRDRRGELAERGELLALGEARARRRHRLELALDHRGGLEILAPALARQAEEVAQRREGRAVEAEREERDVAPVELEANADP